MLNEKAFVFIIFGLFAKIRGFYFMKRGKLFIWLFFSTLLCGCGGTDNKVEDRIVTTAPNNEIKPIKFDIQRFEKDLFEIKSETFTADTNKLYYKYGSFFDLFCSQVIRLGNRNQPIFKQNLLHFIEDPDVSELQKEITKQFPDIKEWNEKAGMAFGRYHAAFPDSSIPKIYAINSALNYNIVIGDSCLAIGLDMYLGEDFKFYKWRQFEKYKTEKMTKNLILSDLVRGFCLATFDMKAPQQDLVSWMIYHGKILYLTQQLLPEESKENILTYNLSQLKWCEEHESDIWAHFIERKIFFSSDFKLRMDYINDGPFTKGFPKEAPARVGVWLGLQIVNSYMLKHPDVTLPQLMNNQDLHQIFNQSGYKPNRK
jgi:hypothetical protein